MEEELKKWKRKEWEKVNDGRKSERKDIQKGGKGWFWGEGVVRGGGRGGGGGGGGEGGGKINAGPDSKK